MKLYLLDANENIIAMPPTKDLLSLIQDLKLKDTDTIEGALVVSKRYTSIMDNVRYIAVSDRDNDHAFYLYRKTMAEVQDRELIFDGKESFWDDLAGSYIKDKRPGAMLAPDLVKLILDGTRWNVDFVDSGFTETLNTNFYYQSRSDALSNVMSAMTIDIVPMINIEGNTITRRYVNLYLQAGGDNGRRFVYGKNALSVVKKTDDSQVFTALVGRGKSIEQTTTDTETGDTSTYNTPKINFADVEWSKAAGDPVDKPKGQEYVEWPESTNLYGYSNGNPRIGIVDFDNDDDPAQLLKDTWAQLQTTGVPSVQFSATVGDVGYLNKGETVTIVNYIKGIAYKTRVTELKWNRLAEAKSQLTIGDKLVQNANERMASIAMQQSSTAIQAATQTIEKQVANLVTVTNSLGVNVSWSKDGTLPLEPKEGDIVYIRNDDGTITMKSYKDGQWVIIVDDTTGQQVQKKVDAKLVQLNADMSTADENLKSAKQDVADLQVKLKANDDTQAQLKNDLSENSTILEKAKADIVTNTQALSDLDTKLKANDDAQAQLQDDLAANTKVQAQLTTDLADNVKLVNANKESVNAALVTVNETLNQAKTDTATAVKNADLAVTNAQSALDASGLATNTANSANDAATAAKNLATSTANSFATVQSQASTAVSDAADAISAANKAQGDATSALGNSNTAISNAKDALNKYNNLSVGGTNLIPNSSTPQVLIRPDQNLGYPSWVGIRIYKGLKNNETYTFSALATAETTDKSAEQWGIRIFQMTGNHESIAKTLDANTGKRQSLTFTTPDDGISYDIWIYAGAMGKQYTPIDLKVVVTVSDYKLETGTMATDWSPAPEDVQVQISNINGELSQKVSQTDYDNLQGTVTSQGTSITANSKEIALAAKQSVVDTLSQQVTDNTSQLKLTATAASLEVTSKKVDTISQTVTDQGAKLDLTATSAQLKVTENKVDALNKTVSDNSAQLKLTATSAALETQSKRVDTISGNVDTNTAAITAANGAIELKANNSTVDTLSSTVKQQGIDLKAAQGQLALKLTQSDLTNGLAGYATQTWAKNEITANSEGLEAKLSSVTTKLDNLQVGGTNLLKNGDFTKGSNGFENWVSDGTTIAKSGDMMSITATATGYRIYSAKSPINNPFNGLTIGDPFSVSFDAYSATAGAEISIGQGLSVNQTVSARSFKLTTSKARYNFTGTCMGALTFSIYVPVGTTYFGKIKVERGNKATDWSPAPEDSATYTDAKVADLKLTVDGLSATFAKQTDLEKATSDFKVTSDGLNLITAVTGTKGENVTQVIADVNNIKTTMTGANGYTTRLQTLEGFQQTATDSISGLQSAQTQLADTIINSVGSANLVVNSEFANGADYWKSNESTPSYNVTYVYTSLYQGSASLSVKRTGQTAENYALYYCQPVAVTEGSPVSAGAMAVLLPDIAMAESYDHSGIALRFLDANKTALAGIDSAVATATSASQGKGWMYLKIENIVAPTGAKYAQMYFRTAGNGHILYSRPQLSKTTSLPAYTPGSVDAAQLTIMQNEIDLRATVAGKVTAALNLSNDGGGTVTIRGASLYVTADSHFDNASIQSAAIAGLAAEKITSGSISSDRLATTKLNADNITSGSISAARIASTAINANNITSGSIAAERIATTELSATNITSGTFDASKMTVKNINAGSITSGSIATALLASTKINADNITSGSIAAERLAATKISATNIIGGTFDAGTMTVKHLSADMITSGTLDASNLTVKSLSASSIVGGTLDGLLMTVKNINASSINTGTLNAAGLNVIGLNASAITTGTISGANLAINLNTGEVLFTKGSIKSTTGTLDIEIEDGTFSQRNSSGAGFLMSQGNLYFSATSFWDALDKNEYALSTLIPDYGYLGFGDMIATKRGMALYGKDSLSLGLIDTSLSVDYFDNTQGFISIKKDDSMTVHGGGKGLILVGGTTKTGTTMPTSPSIFVGSNVDGSGAGSRVFVDASTFTAPCIYNTTGSTSANVYVTAAGTLQRSISATKYKTSIERSRSTEMGETLIQLPTAKWLDKAEMARYASGEQTTPPKFNFGMIAEDLAAAGLEDLVARGVDGELEGINYDRIAPALLPLLAKMKQEIEELKSAAKSA